MLIRLPTTAVQLRSSNTACNKCITAVPECCPQWRLLPQQCRGSDVFYGVRPQSAERSTHRCWCRTDALFPRRCRPQLPSAVPTVVPTQQCQVLIPTAVPTTAVPSAVPTAVPTTAVPSAVPTVSFGPTVTPTFFWRSDFQRFAYQFGGVGDNFAFGSCADSVGNSYIVGSSNTHFVKCTSLARMVMSLILLLHKGEDRMLFLWVCDR